MILPGLSSAKFTKINESLASESVAAEDLCDYTRRINRSYMITAAEIYLVILKQTEAVDTCEFEVIFRAYQNEPRTAEVYSGCHHQ